MQRLPKPSVPRSIGLLVYASILITEKNGVKNYTDSKVVYFMNVENLFILFYVFVHRL